MVTECLKKFLKVQNGVTNAKPISANQDLIPNLINCIHFWSLTGM